jgi:hypothetical protein
VLGNNSWEGGGVQYHCGIECHFGIFYGNVSRSWDSSVGIAVGYRLNAPGLIPSTARFFSPPQRSRPTLGLTQPPIQLVRGAFHPRVKTARA